MRISALLIVLLPLSARASAQSTADQGVPNIRVLADSVAQSGTSFTKTRRLVHWVNDSFKWSYTDYQQRTPAQIIARRSGNCAELASVLHLLLDSLGVRSRWIREINVQPAPTERRQRTAAEMVTTRGNRYSVFGLQHNVAAGETRGGVFATDRTNYYLIDGFDMQLYGGQLAALPAWAPWVDAVRKVSPRALSAFSGNENLHSYTTDIANLKATYDALGREAVARGLKRSR